MSASDIISNTPGATLTDYTSTGLIIADLHGTDTAAVIQELSVALGREGRIADWPAFSQAALDREHLCGTVTEPDWALPHVRVKGIDNPCFALGRAHTPIAWVGHQPLRVRWIFLLAAPETEAQSYLTLLAALARLSADTPLLDRLLKASHSLEILELLRRVNMSAGSSSGNPSKPD